MSGTIFDAFEEPTENGQKDFFDMASKAPAAKDNGFFNEVKEYGKVALKGFAEGLGRLGQVMGPLKHKTLTPEQELQQQTENLNKLLPTSEEENANGSIEEISNFGKRGLRRSLQQAPTIVASPGKPVQAAVRSLAAGFVGQGAKDLGAPEWAQSALELTTFIGPDFTKKLLEKGSNKEIIQFAKKMGMTDEQIAPLIQSDFKKKWLSKLSSKGSSTQEAIKGTHQGIQNVYRTVEESIPAAKEISELSNGKLINGIREKFDKLPSNIRDKVSQDLNDLIGNKITGKSLINFWGDLNSQFASDKAKLQILKGPIMDALESISPVLAKDFDLTNKLYSKFYPIRSALKPKLMDQIVNAGEVTGVLASVIPLMWGDATYLAGIIGEQGVRKLSQQMLINPRFQQLGRRVIEAINTNKAPIVMQTVQAYIKELEKNSPEAAQELKKLSKSEIEEFFSNQQQK